MASYGDPELLVGQWLIDRGFNVRADPDLRPDSWADAPLVHLQRGQGLGQVPLSLDDVTIDVNVYSAVADSARKVASDVWAAITLQLPLTTFDNGIFVTGTWTLSAPVWGPDPSAYRRTAAYRVMLHGFQQE